jgi:hypothetical protein
MDWRDFFIRLSQKDSELEARYPRAGSVVGEFQVMPGPVPNLESLDSSLNEYDTLPVSVKYRYLNSLQNPT